MSKTETYASIWDALADTPEQAANLRARAELMQKIAAIVKASDWTQADAAKQCGVTQPRMNGPRFAFFFGRLGEHRYGHRPARASRIGARLNRRTCTNRIIPKPSIHAPHSS